MPDPITPATAAMADAHDALREKSTPDPWRVFNDENADYLITLANDDVAMCAAVRERDALRAEVEQLANIVEIMAATHPDKAIRAELRAALNTIEARPAALNPGGGDA